MIHSFLCKRPLCNNTETELGRTKQRESEKQRSGVEKLSQKDSTSQNAAE